MELIPTERISMDIHGDDDADPGVEKVDQLQWAEIQRLPSLKRLRTSLFEGKRVVDVAKLGALERHLFIDKLIKHIENDNLRLLRKLRNRIDRFLFIYICIMQPTFTYYNFCQKFKAKY